jgi:glutaredoxin-related protein
MECDVYLERINDKRSFLPSSVVMSRRSLRNFVRLKGTRVQFNWAKEERNIGQERGKTI